MNIRELAFISLEKCRCADRFSNIEIDTVIRRNEMSREDRALFTVLVYGCIEKRINLDYIIGLYSKIPTEKLEGRVLTLLRLGAYQILYLTKVPDSAACNETVKLCKKYSHKGADGFVNAILRRIASNKNGIPYPDKEKNHAEYCSVFYSLPVWIIELWEKAYGKDRAMKICEATSHPANVTLRVNTLKTDRVKLLGKLREAGIEATATERSAYGIRLMQNAAISDETGKLIDDGLCFVQDESSQLCCKEVGAKEGETVFDVCACPGGKSFGMAMDMKNTGKLLSFDLHENKLSLITKGAEKLGICIIETSAKDGRIKDDTLLEKADRVLCDVPCSGLGVIAKKPELRFKKKEDVEALPDTQFKILQNASAYVKHGGTLVYSTCTLNPAENEENADRFIRENADFVYDGEGKITVFPDDYGTDGFFTAKFIRK